jgi:hypothetical protein
MTDRVTLPTVGSAPVTTNAKAPACLRAHPYLDRAHRSYPSH